MKFTLDAELTTRIDTTRDVGVDLPFVQEVLAVDGVASVFGVSNFVTITRDPGADWDAIVSAVEESAAEHLGDEPGAVADDEVARARDLLRRAVAPRKSSAVEIGPPPVRHADPDES